MFVYPLFRPSHCPFPGYTTVIEVKEAEELIEEDIIKAHKKYAEEIIKMYHGEEKIAIAEERYNKIAKGEIPS